MTANEVALLLMAGGQSRRFGDADKLLAPIDGQALALHVAGRLAPMNWGQRIAIAGDALAPGLCALGFAVVTPAAGNGLGDNIALGAERLDSVSAVLIVLADMPFVTAAHVAQMLDAAESQRSVVCTRFGTVTSPPTVIGRDYFPHLRGLSGDDGAKAVVQAAGAEVVAISADEKLGADIDTIADLERWRNG
jgi:molybdenum cofactor cytidylyltransferase